MISIILSKKKPFTFLFIEKDLKSVIVVITRKHGCKKHDGICGSRTGTCVV